MVAALTSPLTSGGLGLRLTSLFNSPADGASVVDSLHIDASQLKLADESDGWKKVVLDVVALTFRENGQSVFSGSQKPFDPGTQTTPARLGAGYQLRLGTQLPPGEYVLQLVGDDELVKGKRRTATQWIDFEIVK